MKNDICEFLARQSNFYFIIYHYDDNSGKDIGKIFAIEVGE